MKRAWERVHKSDDPVELPMLLRRELPFRYPSELFAQQIQGEVTLRLYIDSLGSVVPESTQVAEHATLAAFDSAALGGSSQLTFRPARRGDRRIGYTVLFPIKFRVPGAPTPPEDTMRVRK
jgi:TonB family protein